MTDPGTGSGGKAGFVVLTVLTAVALAVLLALGSWQMSRLAWKEDLIARVEERINAAPGPLPAPDTWSTLTDEAVEYRPVSFTATYDNAREVHVFIALAQPKGKLGGQGYFVMVPATLEDGRIVFVNRGFVPLDRKDASTRPEGRLDGPRTINGLMRPAEAASWISPADDIAKNVWFVRDPRKMAVAVGLDPTRVAPFTVDAAAGETPGGLPQGGETVVAFTNNHLGYAITWFGLAASLATIWAMLAWKRRR
ncbi:SURF1 family protein [Chthonobacter albigriseus]|uniref:SURF1 family protein n=1 Tax=Chthonobacter albigriseus TaxID=1683161 RepID=UPI003140B394